MNGRLESNMGVAEIVQSLYRGLLERKPSADEVDQWSHALEQGMSLEMIVREFAWSTERAQLTARLTRPLPPPLPDGPALTILDIGAQALEGEDDVFRPLLDGGGCKVIGVEPLEDTHGERLRRDPSWTLLPHFAGDGSRRTFHRTEPSSSSSLYEPNLDRLGDFEGLAEIVTVVELVEVQTTRLDDVVHERVDMLKLDVQGAELDVLRGAERLLEDILVVHAEVEFFPIYKAQPLFDDIFGFLAERGFELFDLPRLVRYSYGGASQHPERLLWADAVFIPNRSRIDQLDDPGTYRLARILHDAYGAVGFGRWLVDKLAQRRNPEPRDSTTDTRASGKAI